MSTIIMSACWPLQGMTPSQKSVLISLADNSNDEGVCWPSVKTIAKRTCLSERSVQLAIKWLCEAGILRADMREGRSTVYLLTPAAYKGKSAGEYHYVYKVIHPVTGQFYIGSRTSDVEPSDDPYMGSGALAKLLDPAQCVKIVLSAHETRDAANIAETASIAATIDQPESLNRKISNPNNAGGNPRSGCTPQELRPAAIASTPANNVKTPAVVAPTPAVVAPRTVKEPSIEPSGNRNKPAATAPDKFDPLAALLENGVDEQTARDWLDLRKAKKAPVTLTVLQTHIREAEKAGMSLQDALATSCSRGWSGFEAKFVQDRQPAFAGADRRGQAQKSPEEVNREAYEILFGKGDVIDA